VLTEASTPLGTIFRLSRFALHADEGGQLHETKSMRKEFGCPVCDSPAIVYPEGEEDRVVCGGCGAFLATRGQPC
jgi:ribosomal protein S27E